MALRASVSPWHPSSAYRSLTDDELITFRHHRAEIKDVVRAGIPLDVVRAAPIAEKARAEPCAYCYRIRCIGVEHFAYDTLHPSDPAAVKRRDQNRYPVLTEEEKRQGEVRSRLGWDAATRRI